MNTSTDKPDFVLETYIKTTPEKLWEALTNGEISKQYFQGDASVSSDFEAGSSYEYTSAAGNRMLIGEIVAVEPHKRLEMTFLPAFMDRPDELSRNVYEISQMGDNCKLTIMHFGVTPELEGVRDGWSKIAARLKTLLETGEMMTIESK